MMSKPMERVFLGPLLQDLHRMAQTIEETTSIAQLATLWTVITQCTKQFAFHAAVQNNTSASCRPWGQKPVFVRGGVHKQHACLGAAAGKASLGQGSWVCCLKRHTKRMEVLAVVTLLCKGVCQHRHFVQFVVPFHFSSTCPL